MLASQRNVLEFDEVSVGYDGHIVAGNVSFSVKSGECFGLVGVNGAGKTSLIKAAIGLRKCLSGSIKISGYKSTCDEAKYHFGYLPERFDPPWFLSGHEFVRFTLSLYKSECDEARLEEYCRDIGLDLSVLHKKMTTYSKGMRQKLGLVATLMSDVSLLILDEPMSGLDPLARVNVKTLLQKASARGMTVFLSSHILVDLDELCDRIAILDHNRIQFLGAPQLLKEKYKHSTLERAFLQLIEGQTLREENVAA